jgi:hypothetical protein
MTNPDELEALTVQGRMDDGSPARFSVETACGDMGFIGRCVTPRGNAICKQGYIPFTSLDTGEAGTARAHLIALRARTLHPLSSDTEGMVK